MTMTTMAKRRRRRRRMHLKTDKYLAVAPHHQRITTTTTMFILPNEIIKSEYWRILAFCRVYDCMNELVFSLLHQYIVPSTDPAVSRNCLFKANWPLRFPKFVSYYIPPYLMFFVSVIIRNSELIFVNLRKFFHACSAARYTFHNVLSV